MSDPAKSANEIEDVLASIRRLIGEANAQPAGPGDPGGVEPERPSSATSAAGTMPPSSLEAPLGRLLLTPALRVTDPDDPWAPVPVQTLQAPAMRAGTSGARRDPHRAGAEPSWGRDDRLADWGQIAPGASHGRPGSAAATPPAAHDAGARPAAAEFEAEAGDANWPDGNAGSALRDLVLARGADTAPDSMAETRPTHPAQAQSIAGADPEPGQFPDNAPQGRAAPDALRQSAGQPDDAAKARRPAERSIVETAPETIPAEPRAPEGEIGLLDEDTLREIVAEVVREELQGVLGQRITRNVRKMVRREIRLALAADDLD